MKFSDPFAGRQDACSIFGIDDLAIAALGGSVISALSGNKAAKTAANTQADATAQQIALQKQQYDQTRQDLSPYTSTGGNALTSLSDRLNGSNVFSNTGAASSSDPDNFSYDTNDYKASPAYAVQLKGGVDAIDASMAHRGALDSGATLKSLDKYGSDLALQDFSQERNYAAGRYDTDRGYLTNRYDTATNGLSSLTNLGESAAAGVGNAGQNYANSAGNALQTGAAATANAGLVSANNLNGVIGQGINALAYSQKPTNASIVNQYTPASVAPPAWNADGTFNPSSLY